MANADFTQPVAGSIDERSVWLVNPNVDTSAVSNDLGMMLKQIKDTLYLIGLSESDLISQQVATTCYGLALQVEKVELLQSHLYSRKNINNEVKRG